MRPRNDQPAARQADRRRWTLRPGSDPIWGWAVGGLLFVFVALLLPRSVPLALRFVAAWDIAALAWIGMPWWTILRSTAHRTRDRAAREDPGRVALLVIALLSCVVALSAAIVVLREPAALSADLPVALIVAVGVGAVLSAWMLLHTAFALHYAHLYYRDNHRPGGIRFPQHAAPDDFDFAYFALMLGIGSQASEVTVEDRRIRRVVLGHALVSFAFNTVILALTISLIFELLK